VLDMTFDEDSCRARKGHAAENLVCRAANRYS
jgi:predicted transposase YbfD/YdcC